MLVEPYPILGAFLLPGSGLALAVAFRLPQVLTLISLQYWFLTLAVLSLLLEAAPNADR
jgi:hypothetical protein